METYLEKYSYLQDYIQANAKKHLTKKNKELDLCLFESIDVNKCNKELSKFYQKPLDKKFQECLAYKKDIMYYLDNQFTNVLITGVGSKSEFLDNIIQSHLTDYPVLTINGFMSGITMKYILNKICSFLSNCVAKEESKGLNLEEEQIKVVKRSKIQQLQYVKEVLNGEEENFIYERVYVVIYSLDGKPLRSPECQQILSEIAAAKKVILLASIDDYRYQTLLNPQMIENFNFKIFHIDTFGLYDKEFIYIDDNTQSQKKKSLEGLKYIFKSLTPNQKDIIKNLSKYFLDNPLSKEIEFKAFFKRLYDNAILSNDSQLKQNLVEIIDHKVIKEYKGDRGKTMLTMDFTREVLDQISNGEFD